MRTAVSWVEFHLHNPDKLKTLSNERLKYFWSNRDWHPEVQMAWLAGINSNGEGLTTYPDGSKGLYPVGIDRKR